MVFLVPVETQIRRSPRTTGLIFAPVLSFTSTVPSGKPSASLYFLNLGRISN